MMRESRLVELKAPDEFALVPGQRELEINEVTDLLLRVLMPRRVDDSAEPEVRPAVSCFPQTQVVHVRFQHYSEVDVCKSLEISKCMERHRRIALAVDGNDISTPTPQQLIDAQVLDVPPVRDVDECSALVGRGHQFAKKMPDAWAACRGVISTRLPQPRVESQIQNRKPEARVPCRPEPHLR